MLERFDLFMNNYQNMYYSRPMNNTGDRQFIFTFLTGALVGGAAIGLTRPRPIINAAPQPGYGPGPMPPYYRPGAPYSYYSYGGYIPGPYGY